MFVVLSMISLVELLISGLILSAKQFANRHHQMMVHYKLIV